MRVHILTLLSCLAGIIPSYSQDTTILADEQYTGIEYEETAINEPDTATQTSWADSLRSRLAPFATEAEQAYYTSGICVYDLTADTLLFQYNQNKVMRPASTQKVLTAISALTVLGGSYTFNTDAYISGTVTQEGILQGDIYVVGGFDPAFDTADINRLANAITSLGIRRINGRIYGDVSMKDSLYMGSGWCWDDVPSDVMPYLTPLILNRGCATVEVVNGRPQLALPSSFITLTDRTGGLERFRLTRDWLNDNNNFILTGRITRGATRTISVRRPELYFLCTLADILRRKGVTFTTGNADMPHAPHTEYALQTRPANVTNKIFSCTRTVDQILQKMMKDSDNLYAESMFYLLAAHGGKRHVEWEDGAHRVDSVMRRVDTWAMAEVADGSGLSLYNYVSPRTMTLMLRYAYLNPNIYNYFMPSLPLAGVDGTLEHRMQNGTAHRNVRAKTGTVSGVSTLAGYCRASNGHLLAFTIMNNGLIKTAVARRFQDRLCQELTK